MLKSASEVESWLVKFWVRDVVCTKILCWTDDYLLVGLRSKSPTPATPPKEDTHSEDCEEVLCWSMQLQKNSTNSMALLEKEPKQDKVE